MTWVVVVGNGCSKGRMPEAGPGVIVSANMGFPCADYLVTRDLVGLRMLIDAELPGKIVTTSYHATDERKERKAFEGRWPAVVVDVTKGKPVGLWEFEYERGLYSWSVNSGVFAVQFALNHLRASRVTVVGFDGYTLGHRQRQDGQLAEIMYQCPDVKFDMLFGRTRIDP